MHINLPVTQQENNGMWGDELICSKTDQKGYITYANEATKDLIRKNLEAFRKFSPGIDPDRLVGAARPAVRAGRPDPRPDPAGRHRADHRHRAGAGAPRHAGD